MKVRVSVIESEGDTATSVFREEEEVIDVEGEQDLCSEMCDRLHRRTRHNERASARTHDKYTYSSNQSIVAIQRARAGYRDVRRCFCSVFLPPFPRISSARETRIRYVRDERFHAPIELKRW